MNSLTVNLLGIFSSIGRAYDHGGILGAAIAIIIIVALLYGLYALTIGRKLKQEAELNHQRCKEYTRQQNDKSIKP